VIIIKGSYEKPSITSINNGGDVSPNACTLVFAVLVLALAVAAGGGVVVVLAAAGGAAAAAAAVWAAAWYATSTNAC